MIKPFELRWRGEESEEEEEGDFKVAASKLLFNFKHLLLSYRWSDDHSKNYKEWFLQVVNDSLLYLLKLNEPVYAFHLLKQAETFLRTVIYPLPSSLRLSPAQVAEVLPVVKNYQITNPPPDTFIDFIKDETSVEFQHYQTLKFEGFHSRPLFSKMDFSLMPLDWFGNL